MNQELLHFDSAYATYSLPNNDPFDAKFDLSNTIREAKRIYLKSIEMPITFANIRSGGTLNKIILSTNLGNTYTVSVAQANYSTIDTLLTAINNAFVGVVPNTTVTFSYSGTKVTVAATSSTITSFSLTDTNLSKYVLGFRNATFSGLSTTAPIDFFLNVDNYVVMWLKNVASDNTSCNGRINCSFKIPLQAVNGMVYFAAEGSGMQQSIRLMDTNGCYTYFQVQIYDRFDTLILGNNTDYSFSLGLEY